jgi:hypothetical protein
MDLTEGIFRGMARAGRMLALLAVLFLAFNPHPLHAQSNDGAGHSDVGPQCEALDAEKSSSGGHDGMQGIHGDCLHHFDPLVRAPVHLVAVPRSIAQTSPYGEPARQLALTSDPPPPRNPS